MAIEDIPESRSVKSVSPMDAVIAAGVNNNKEEKQRKKDNAPRKKVRDFFHPLSKAVEATNKHLIEQKLPYRFNVYKRWGDVFIEMFTLNEDGTVRQKQRKNISHNDFNRIIDDVVSIEGLFFDLHA